MYAAPIAPHQRPVKPNRLPNADDFPYGEVISPVWDRIGGGYDEHNRKQLCVDRGTVKLIERLSAKITYEPWIMGKWVHRRGKTDITRVVTTSYGYRSLNRLDDRYHFLCLATTLAEVPFLFPMAEIAIKAMEIKLQGLDEAWIFSWLNWING